MGSRPRAGLRGIAPQHCFSFLSKLGNFVTFCESLFQTKKYWRTYKENLGSMWSCISVQVHISISRSCSNIFRVFFTQENFFRRKETSPDCKKKLEDYQVSFHEQANLMGINYKQCSGAGQIHIMLLDPAANFHSTPFFCVE